MKSNLIAIFLGAFLIFAPWVMASTPDKKPDTTFSVVDITTLPDEPPVEKPLCDKRPCILVVAILGSIGGSIDVGIASFLAKAESEKADALVFVIASPGGDFNKSEQIFNLIKDTKIPTFCFAHNIAASGAFWILQACDERAADPQARLMTHSPMISAKGGTMMRKADLLSALAEIDMLDEIQSNAISTRMGMDPEEYKKRLGSNDWWFSPQSAKRANAIDQVIDFDKYLLTIPSKIKKTKK